MQRPATQLVDMSPANLLLRLPTLQQPPPLRYDRGTFEGGFSLCMSKFVSKCSAGNPSTIDFSVFGENAK